MTSSFFTQIGSDIDGEDEINDLLGEDPYIGETDWRGNKVPTKRDYSKKIR